MANEKGMSEEKRARLEAIRAANRAKQGGGGAPAPRPVAATTAAPAAPAPAPAAPAARPAAATTAAPAAAPPSAARPAAAPAAGARAATDANLPADQKARLAAIRAANSYDQRTAAAPAPVQVRAPAPPATPALAARPAPAPRPQQPPAAPIVPDDRIPMQVQLWRAVIGAVIGVILCVGFATMTGNYIIAGISGAVMGALGGLLVLNWPPQHTTGD